MGAIFRFALFDCQALGYNWAALNNEVVKEMTISVAGMASLTPIKFELLGCTKMPEDYFKKRLLAQENEIDSLRAVFESARQRGNKKLMGISRKRLEMALGLREMYERMLKREGVDDQLA